MKLVSTPILLSAVALSQKTEEPPVERPMSMLRTVNTDNPFVADFTSPVLADLAYISPPGGGSSYNCVYIRTRPVNEGSTQDLYDAECDYTIGSGSFHGVPCEWRGTDISTVPAATGSQNGWHCNTANTACFATIESSVDWWAGLDLCESTFGMKLAAPKDQSEVELITHNFRMTGETARVWLGAFWDNNLGAYYWPHDSPQTAASDPWITDDSAAVHSFVDLDFMDQVSQDVPTEILENMLVDHGLTQSGNRRKREAATHSDTISQLIERNGCWCPKALAAGAFFPGAPLNSYDTACRKLSHCVNKASTCSSGACFTENLNGGYQYAIDVLDLSKGYSCRATHACDTAICMCQVEFAKEVFELVVADGNTMTIADAHLDLVAGNTQCVASSGAGTSSISC